MKMLKKCGYPHFFNDILLKRFFLCDMLSVDEKNEICKIGVG